MGYLADTYKDLNPLKTDMYQLTMAQGYFDQGRADEEATFYMHWRKPAFDGGYTVAAGLEGVIDFLNNFEFKPEHIAFLRAQEKKGKRLFSDEFLEYLSTSKLKLQVDAVPEGTAMTSSGPVVRITGPLVQAQLVESAILNIVNSSSIVATRAARLSEATEDKASLADFSLRRSATLDPSVARSSTIGGIGAVADVDASMKLGVNVTGTMAHAWIMGFKGAVESYVQAKKAGKEDRWVSPYYKSPDRVHFETLIREAVDEEYPNVTNSAIELAAFKAYLTTMPHNSVLLVDTYDPAQGIRNAIRAAKEMNVELDGVRLDSGDLYAQAWLAKDLVDEARAERPDLFANTKTYATDSLNEERILEMRERALQERGEELPIQAYGVGTKLGNPGPLGGVYKVSASEIVKEVVETRQNADGEWETVVVGSETIPIEKDHVRTMKVAGRDPNNPALPGPKSSMPGVALNTLRLRDAEGKIMADVIIDEALRSGAEWKDLLAEGVVDVAGNKVDLSAATQAETLLAPIFARGKEGISEYVYDEPAKKPAYAGGPDVTDLYAIQEACKQQRAQLPMERRRVNGAEVQPIMMDPRVQEMRAAIMAQMDKEPGTEIAGDLSAQMTDKSKQV